VNFFNFLNNQLPYHTHWNEQMVFQHYYDNNEKWKSIIKLCPQRAFNAYMPEMSIHAFGHPTDGDFHKGDYLVHWAGCSLEHSIKLALSDRLQKTIIYPIDYNN